jgi:hypothetical protein
VKGKVRAFVVSIFKLLRHQLVDTIRDKVPTQHMCRFLILSNRNRQDLLSFDEIV